MSQMLNNRYLIIQELGAGGFGDTFLAEDTQMPSRRKCVIKRLKPVNQNPQLSQLIQQRFQREAALLEDLGRHSQIPTLYAYFQEGSEFYLIQELIEGKTLSNKIAQEGLMNENAVRDFLKNILPVLNFVHNKRIVHRDIKPDNIIIRYSDGMPILIDFGAVKESLGTVVNTQGQAASSIVIGTPGFMPSEQAAGRPVFSSDLYSIGLTCIYLLTGKYPQELDVDPRNGEIIWRQYAPQLSPELAGVIDRAIHSHAPQRFASAREMLDALQSGQAYQFSGSMGDIPPTVVERKTPNSVPPPGGNYPTPQPGGQYPQPTYPTPGGQYPQPGYPTPQPGGQYPQPGYPVNPYQPSTLVGGGGTFNTLAPVPPEIRGWNWGAFMLPHFWCLTNQVWIGLLAWIPFVGAVMAIVLGAQGNVWAWRSRQWRSVEQFKSHQKGWTIAGITVWSLVLALIFIGAIADNENTSTDTSNNSTTSVSPSPETDTSTPVVSNTSNSGDTETLPVEIGQLEAYQHKTGLFSIDVPQDWTLKEQSTSERVFLGWQDKNNNGAILVIVGQESQPLSDKVLGDKLKQYIDSTFNTKDLKVESTSLPVKQPNGSSRISFTLRDKSLNVLLTGNSFIEQKNNKLSYFLVFVPQSQYDKLLPSINMVIGSYTLNGNAALQ